MLKIINKNYVLNFILVIRVIRVKCRYTFKTCNYNNNKVNKSKIVYIIINGIFKGHYSLT